ncbi:MAG TPA: Kazal-type serine protease inhibitor domain-containing protein [Thermoanaerobaculia bacterium]|jgi:hypothetical protein
MVRKAIVKMCMVVALVLLVGAASRATAADAAGAKAGAKAQMCGGIAGLKCPEGEACRYPINKCNVADLSGTCVKVPATCKPGGAKVCGCDGKTYDNMCELLKAGVREASKGACKKAA